MGLKHYEEDSNRRNKRNECVTCLVLEAMMRRNTVNLSRINFVLALISATLIKCSVNFRTLNFQYFNPNFGTCPDILDT